MTHFLASVLDHQEVDLALAACVDIIDLKDPRSGALGAWPLPAVKDAVERVARRRPVSATVGDLPMEPALLAERVGALAATGVDYVKVGLFADPGLEAGITALGRLAADVALVGVLFADRRPDLELVRRLAMAGFTGVMLDTAGKDHGGLRRHVSDAGLARFLGYAASQGLCGGLAGSLGLDDIAPLLALGPEFLGFRGALCAGARRTGSLDAQALERVRQAIPRPGAPAGSGPRSAFSESPADFLRSASGAGGEALPY